MKKFLLLCLLIIPLGSLFAAEDFYHFKTPEQQERFQQLTTELRCLVCQNQNLAESNAALASDLRYQIYQQVLQDHSNTEIVNYLVARYGDFILYRPPLNIATFGLWFGPLLLLLAGLSYLIYYLKKNRQQAVS
jgi:cytochrome c-type biogenesis protein CcmH